MIEVALWIRSCSYSFIRRRSWAPGILLAVLTFLPRLAFGAVMSKPVKEPVRWDAVCGTTVRSDQGDQFVEFAETWYCAGHFCSVGT